MLFATVPTQAIMRHYTVFKGAQWVYVGREKNSLSIFRRMFTSCEYLADLVGERKSDRGPRLINTKITITIFFFNREPM